MRPICSSCWVTRSSSAVPAGEIDRLRNHPVGQLLHPQHRLDAGDQSRLIDWLGQIFVSAGVKSGDDVLRVGFCGYQNNGHERQIGVGLQPAANFETVELRHHHVE
jgi:hypothetical protein